VPLEAAWIHGKSARQWFLRLRESLSRLRLGPSMDDTKSVRSAHGSNVVEQAYRKWSSMRLVKCNEEGAYVWRECIELPPCEDARAQGPSESEGDREQEKKAMLEHLRTWRLL
jgi:hypothetical protein